MAAKCSNPFNNLMSSHWKVDVEGNNHFLHGKILDHPIETTILYIDVSGSWYIPLRSSKIISEK